MRRCRRWCRLVRYGNVRQTDTSMIAAVVNGMVARICSGCRPSAHAINDEEAEGLFQDIVGVQGALAVLDAPEQFALWYETLACIGSGDGYHGLTAGRACRILLDAGIWRRGRHGGVAARALSPSVDPAHAAAGGRFLRRSMYYITDQRLWRMVDDLGVRSACPKSLPRCSRSFAAPSPPSRWGNGA